MSMLGGLPPTAAKLSHVEESLNRLDRNIAELADHVNTLPGRLTNVLRPEPPQVASTTTGEQAQVPLANTIHDLAYRVHNIDLIVSSILDRLEL